MITLIIKRCLHYDTCGIRMWTQVSFVVTIHAFDRRTDGRTFRSWLRPPCTDTAR